MNRTLRVGVDVGGSKIAALVAPAARPGADRQALGRAEVATDVTTPERTLDGIAEAVQLALAQAQAAWCDVAAVGLGIPGRVRPETGWVESAVNLRWRRLSVGPLLSERFGVPCFLENDSRAAALGAYQAPGEQRYQNWAYLSVGTGIASGLMLGGELYRGPNGMAGEIGHIVVAPDGPLCACGLRGCLETMAAGPAIVKHAQALLGAAPAGHQPRWATQDGGLTTRRIYEAAAEGDELALAVTRQAGRCLAQAVHGLVMTCDVERVVFGGGVSRAGVPFLHPIIEALEQMRAASPLASEVLPADIVGLVPAEVEAPLWGALAVAERGYSRARVPGG
jgi:glucokinase